jgi:hypothetical protein
VFFQLGAPPHEWIQDIEPRRSVEEPMRYFGVRLKACADRAPVGAGQHAGGPLLHVVKTGTKNNRERVCALFVPSPQQAGGIGDGLE